MKSIRNTMLAILCFSALAPAQKVVHQYDRAVDFSNFHTYRWVMIQGSPVISQITATNIVNLVNTQLALKGLTAVTSNQVADIYVAFQASVAQQQQLNWFTSGGAWKGVFGQSPTGTIDTGTLVIDIYNPARKQLIWRGTATNTLNPSGDADKNYNNLQKAIEKLLKPFPPQVKK